MNRFRGPWGLGMFVVVGAVSFFRAKIASVMLEVCMYVLM